MKTTNKLLAVFVLLVSVIALGQEKSTSAKAVQRLNRAPVNQEVLRVHLPRPMELQLPNGLTVLVLEQHKLPTIAATLWIKTGALSDPKGLPGLANFTADMLHEGTPGHSSEQIARELDAIGGSLSASAEFGKGITRVNASGLVEFSSKVFELMSDVVIDPSFPQSELNKYKTRRLPQLEQQRSEPGFLTREKFYRVLYQSFPASVIAPTPEAVNLVSAKDLRDYHDQYYVPGNAILGIVGDVTVSQAKALVDRYFGSWEGRAVSPAKLPEIPPATGSKIYLIDRPASVQTYIIAGNYGLKRTDPNYIPLMVLNRIEGSGPASRLFLNLREEKGYTYGAYSSVTADIYPGVFAASTEVRNAVTDGSMHELLGELRRIREEPVSNQELDEAQHSMVSQFALSLEQPQRLLDNWLTVKYYGLPLDYWDRYPEEVAKVTPAKIEEIAKKYIDLDHLQIVCVGDGKEIENVLEKYGLVDVTDANGKPLNLRATAPSSN